MEYHLMMKLMMSQGLEISASEREYWMKRQPQLKRWDYLHFIQIVPMHRILNCFSHHFFSSPPLYQNVLEESNISFGFVDLLKILGGILQDNDKTFCIFS